MSHPKEPFHIYYLSEYAVTLQFGEVINDTIFNTIQQFTIWIQENPFTGFLTLVPAYTTVSVFYDPLQVLAATHLKGRDCFEMVKQYLNGWKNDISKREEPHKDMITIPACYGGTFGPDIEAVARLHHLTTEEVVHLHCRSVYKVYMIGFVPGFAYMGGMDEQLATPRKAVPGKAIPAGSIGIAGSQTGIYPFETPGGWQIIGRTPLRLFDATRLQPSLLKAGDRVIFKEIPLEEYRAFNPS